MMPLLSKSFETSSRDEIVELCDRIAEIICTELRVNPDRKHPIIIGITGDINAGKSLFWDRIREQLLKHGGIFVQKKSDSRQSVRRSFET